MRGGRALAGLLLALLSACTSAPRAASVEREMSVGASEGMVSAGDSSGRLSEDERLVARTASARVVCGDPEAGAKAAAEDAKRQDGWVQGLGPSHAVLRVPDARLEAFLDSLAALGEVEDRRVNAEDVTVEHRDSRIRLENLERAQKRYHELLAGAENVAAALAVEKELERVTGEIEVLKGRLSLLDKRVQFATVTVQFEKAEVPGPLQLVWLGVSQLFRWLWVIG